MKSLFREFKHFEGQPVKIFTDDGRALVGIDLNAMEDAVRIIDDCGRLILVEYRHIDSVVEPQMRLCRCCHDHHHNGDRRDDCDRHHDCDDDNDECEEEEREEFGRGRRR